MNELNSIAYSLYPCIVYLICLGLTFFICTMRILVTYLSINASKTSNTVATGSPEIIALMMKVIMGRAVYREIRFHLVN